jgi:hypothetical protein|tara:strand:- start:1969 stop:3072 length:1104 start_codon:yes stop_codon:yes gene_type:complete
MAAISRKDRWWRTRAEKDPRGDWAYLHTDEFPLDTAEGRLVGDEIPKESPSGFQGARFEDLVVQSLGGCLRCWKWDAGSVTGPVDVILKPSNQRHKTLSKRFYENMAITNVFGINMSIAHRALIEQIKPYLDDEVYLGDVVVDGGDQVHDLVSVIDGGAVRAREKYSKNWFQYPGSTNFYPCLSCGRFCNQSEFWPGYVLTSEHANRSPRFYPGAVLLPPEIMSVCNFEDRGLWPKLKIDYISEYGVQLDPFPSPMPDYWEELEGFFIDKGIKLPFHKSMKASVRPGSWIANRIEKEGDDACWAARIDGMSNLDASTYATMVFYLRMRAFFEKKVSERIDHWSDEQLARFLVEYNEECGYLPGYFPV